MGQTCESGQANLQFKGPLNPQLLNLRSSVKKKTNDPYDKLSEKIKQRITELKNKCEQMDKISKFEIIEVTKNIYYQGKLENKEMTGYGRLIMPDGSYYQGYFDHNKLQGQGLLIDTKGGYYLGLFQNSKAEGKGLYVADDFVYQGEFKNNLQSGFGKQSKKEQIFEGSFNKGKKKKGKLTKMSQKTIYQGQFQGNVENGFGRLQINNQIHEGLFKNGYLQGEGKIIYEDASEKTVIFEKGKVLEGERHQQLKVEQILIKQIKNEE